jgi:hypothetical protein
MEYNFYNEDLNPQEFKITFEQIPQTEFLKMVNSFSSCSFETQMGRRFYFVVKNHDYIVGFIRISSPVISISNRNKLFGTRMNSTQINDHMMNGSIIVPVQPFGFNYLGGKLLTVVCVSNEMSDIIKEKVPDYCFLETTSLFGSLKKVCQYDGLEPYLHSFGLTKSDILLLPTSEIINELKDKLNPIYGKPEFNGRVVNTKSSSPRLREFNKLVSIIGKNLKRLDPRKYSDFIKLKEEHMKCHTQRGYYYSFLGYTNVIEHITKGVDLKEQDRHKYDFENLYNWWLKKSINRYNKIKENQTFKKELEIQSMGNVIIR